MSEPQNPRPKDAPTVTEPETESSFDSSTSTAIKLEADTEKDLKTLLTTDVQQPSNDAPKDNAEAAETVSEPTDAVRNKELAALFQGAETHFELKNRLQQIGALDFESLGVSVKPTVDGKLGSSGAFDFPYATQIRGQFGVKTDFTKSPDKAPSYNGEKIKSITATGATAQNPTGSVTIETERGQITLSPAERRKFEFPPVLSFTDAKGNATTILANGDKTIVQSDGSRITQFGPFDQEGRLFKRELDSPDGKSSVTYFQDGRRQLDVNPPRTNGMTSLLERPEGDGVKYEAKMLTPPNEVPQRLAETLKNLSEATKTGDRRQELEAVKKLAELELQSPRAKEALERFAASSPENQGLVRYARFNQEGGSLSVLFGAGALPSGERLHVVRAAADDLTAIAEKTALTPDQLTLAARGMAFALYDSRADKVNGSPPVSQQLSTLLEKSMSGPGREATMKAAVEMVKLGDKPTVNRLGLADAFIPIILKGVEESARDGRSWSAVSQQLDAIKQLSKNGNRAALVISDAIANGGTKYKPGATEQPVADPVPIFNPEDFDVSKIAPAEVKPVSADFGEKIDSGDRFSPENSKQKSDFRKVDSTGGDAREDSDEDDSDGEADANEAKDPAVERAEFFVSAEITDKDDQPAKRKVDSLTSAAIAVFGDINDLSIANPVPEDGKGYKTFGDAHGRVAGMVAEILKGDDQAFADLRIEAGRPDWMGASSVAPSAFHRVSVVKAVLELEKAIDSGDKQKQTEALRELAKMRSIRPGSDYQFVHKAIDDYLKVKTDKQPELIGRDQFNEYRRQSEERLKESFKQSSFAFTAFLTAPDGQKRQQAIDAFQKSANDNPDSKLLEWSSRLGDYGSALNLKQQLNAEKPDAKEIEKALDRLNKTSPGLLNDYLDDILTRLKADPKTGDQFAKVDRLDVDSVKKLIQNGKLDSILPYLKQSMASGQMHELFTELDELKKSKHSPLDLLKAGLSRPNEMNDAIEQNRETLRKEEEEELRKLERDFLKRGAPQEDRDKAIEELRKKAEESRLMIGVMSGPDVYRLEPLNKVLALKETEDPIKASEFLKSLKDSSSAENPHAKAILDKLLPGRDPQKIDELIKTLAAGGDAGRDALKQLKPATRFVEAELGPLRIENLTWNHRGDKPPSSKDLDALQVALRAERDAGNKGADTWLDWCDAAKLVIPLKAGSGATKESRIDNIKQLGDLAKNGNEHARKALLAILVDPVNPQTRGFWNAEFNWQDGPKALHADLPKSVKQESYEYADAAVKALVTAYDGKTDQLGRGEALAMSLALGHWSDRHGTTTALDGLLKKGIAGKNGDAVLAGVYDGLYINAAGGEQLARTILHGAHRPEFEKYMPSFVRWAEAGDKVGMQVLAGLLGGKTDNAGLIKTARETFFKIASDKRSQQPALEALMQAYEQDVKQTDVLKNPPKGNPVILESLGDVLGKTDRANIPDKLMSEVKLLFRREMEFFNGNEKERVNPEQKNRYEHAVRGFVASARHFDKDDIGLLRATPQLAKALGEKDWQLPKALESDFKSRMFLQLSIVPADALACLSNVGKILTPADVAATMRMLPHDMPEATEMASMKFFLGLIGDKNSSQAVKDQALKEIEQRDWKSPQLDTELRKGLSDYVHGRVGDLKQLDRVIALVGNIGIQPPMALVLSRLGLPLDQQTIWEVEEGLRNFNGDREAYSKVIEHAVILNALPKELNLYGTVDLKELVQRMADGPLTDTSDYAMLLGDRVPKLLETLQDLQYGLLEKESAASGNPMNRFQLHDAIFAPWKRGGTIGGGSMDGQVKQSVEHLQNVTRDGHQTSYWWLAAGGVGYLARRFGPGGTEDQFSAKQKDALDAWKSAKEASVKSTLQTTALVNGITQLDTARKVGEYVQLMSNGSFIASDSLALTIAERMGSQGLKTGAPFIYDGLRGTEINSRTGLPAKPGEIWERLRRNHATDLKTAPIFGTEFLGSRDALRFLERADLKEPNLKTDDSYHFLGGKAHDFALHEAFKAVDSGPEYTKAMESYGKLMGVNNSMETLFHMGMTGYKGEEFVKLARQLAKDMDVALNDLKQHEPNIKYLIDTFKDASKNASDPEAKRGLDARVKQLEEMLKMIPGTNGGKNDERYDVTKEMCRLIKSPDFDSESFLKWFKDNAPVLIWTTIAVAGILAMPFSGGASGVLTAIAVSALVATVSYGAVETYKELVYQGGGSAHGSDFLRATLEALTGDKYIQDNIRYDPKTGKFKAPPTRQETFEAALKQIGKDTALNLIGAGFGKLLSFGAKALPASKLAATELAADAKVLVEGLNKVASKNVAASTYGGRFTKIFFEALPLGVVGATTGAIIQDELKAIKDNRELVEFAGHAATICLTVLFHRVGGHLMQPKILRNGALEIPYDKNAFMEAMKQEYGKTGKPMPEYKIEGDSVKVAVGGKVMELRFVDPAKVAADLDAKGVKPKPLLPGEEQKPSDKPAPVDERPGTTSGAKLNKDTGAKPTDAPTAPKFDSKTFNADLEAARVEYLKSPNDPAAKAKLTELLQESVNQQFKAHGIPVEFAPKVSIEPLKSGEHPVSEFSNETYRVRVGEGRLETRSGTVHDPKHEGFHAILSLNRTAAYMHNRPAYMAKLTEAWAADLKAGYDIAGQNGIARPTDQAARNGACDILEPLLKPYSKGLITEAEARLSLDRRFATADGAEQVKVLAQKMGVTPELAKEYLRKELSNFFRLEKWHLLPESYLDANPKLKTYLESIGQKQSGQLGKLIDPLINTHRGLFDPEVYRFSSPEEHRARIRQYSEELKVLIEARGKGAKDTEHGQNLIATIQEQSRLWQLQEQLRKLESAKSPADVKGHLEQIQKLAGELKKDLPPEDPLHTFLAAFDNSPGPAAKPSGKPSGPPKAETNDGKAPTKKSGLEKPSSTDRTAVKPDVPEKAGPESKAVIELFRALLGDAPKTNYNELLGRVKEGKFTPEEVDGLTKLARRDGPELIDRILKLPPEARDVSLNELIRTSASAENLRLPLAKAEVKVGIAKMDSAYQKAMTELASTPEGLELARRILSLPEDVLRAHIPPEKLAQKDVLATVRTAEIEYVERLELERRGGKPPLQDSDVLNPDQLARYKAIKERQDALGTKPVELTPDQVNALADSYLRGEGHAKESLPPDGQVKRGKTMHIVLGAPGAGKSGAIVSRLQSENGCRLIDSDLVKGDMPGYQGGLGTQVVHLASDKVATQVRSRALANGDNIVQPIIGRNPELVHAIIRQARANGYDVAIHLAEVSPTTSAKRVFDRGYAKEPVDGKIQQIIPLTYTLEMVGNRPSIVFDQLLKTPGLVDAWSRYDTNTFPGKLVGQSTRQLPTFKPGSPGSPGSPGTSGSSSGSPGTQPPK